MTTTDPHFANGGFVPLGQPVIAPASPDPDANADLAKLREVTR